MRSRPHRLVGVAVAVLLMLCTERLSAAAELPIRETTSTVVLTGFDQIWRVAESEPGVRHPVQLDYVVYYYDPLWRAMWGRSGDADSYLSLRTKVLPLKSGQRIRIEGTMVPSLGMYVDEPKVTILADSAPIEVLSTVGQVRNSERFNKRVVTVEGYVDRQNARDANHTQLHLIVEGLPVVAELLVRNADAVPSLKAQMIRVRGVYFARNDPSGAKIELWVPGLESVESLGSIDRDPRFSLPVTPIAQLSSVKPGESVRIKGVVRDLKAGQSLVVRDNSGELAVTTTQTRPLEIGERVEMVGVVALHDAAVALDQVLYRLAPKIVSRIDELFGLSEAEMLDVHQLRAEVTVYYYDPYWKVMWCRSGSSDHYVSLGGGFRLHEGQRILVEGNVVPAKGTIIDDPKITVLNESVPVDALSTLGDAANVEKFDKHLAIVEGYVDRQVQTDPQHVELDIVADDRLIAVRLLSDEEVPKLEGTLIRVRGVYSATTDPGGGLPKIEVWVQGKRGVSVRGEIERDERFNAAAIPVERVATSPTTAPVHVSGFVWSQQPGHSIIVRDDTGLLNVHSVQSSRLAVGDPVEAVGYPARQGMESFLAHGLYRRAKVPIQAGTKERQPLRLAEQLRDLSPEEAANGLPVQFTGVVTWAHPNADFFYIRDISGGAYVTQPRDRKAAVIVGLKAEVRGVSAVGNFVPIVAASWVHYTATVDLPEARPVTLEQALTGVEEAQWVSMSGYVRDLVHEEKWDRLELTTSAGEFTALLPPNRQLEHLVGSVVSARGVCSAVTNRKRQLTGIQLWVPAIEYIEVEEPAPADLFSVPLRSVASLRQFNSLQMANRRVRVAGVVLSQLPGHSLQLQDGSDGVLVLSRSIAPLTPGDRIEAVGFPGRESSRVVLREAVYRRTAAGAEPVPVQVKTLLPADPELDGRLVHISAQLLDLSDQEKGVRLILQANTAIFEGLLDVPKGLTPDDWRVGSRVEVTGVYLLEFDEYKRPQNVRLQLRSAADVRVISRASWWTVTRVLALTAVLAIGTIMGWGWVVALRRRVHQQTNQIREQLEKEKAARLEAALARASKLELGSPGTELEFAL